MSAMHFASQIESSFDADELLALARFEAKQGSISSALAKLKNLTSRPQVPAGAFSIAGQVYTQLELWDHAQAMFEKHLEVHPDAPEETHFLAFALFQAGRSQEALKLWDG